MNNDRISGTEKKFEGSAQNTYGNVTGSGSDEVKGAAKKVVGEIQGAYGKAQDYAKDSYKAVESHINDKPVSSAFIALAIGYVLGKFSR